MTAPLVLGSLDEQLDGLPGARALLSASAHVQLAWLPGTFVRDFVIRHEAPDALVAELALVFDSAGAELAQIGPVALRLLPATDSERPLLLRVTLGDVAAPALSLALFDLRIGVAFQQPWLRRVDLATGRTLDEAFRFEADAMLRVASDGSTNFVLYGLSVPAFAIARTGIVIALEDCQLALGGSGLPLSVRDLVTQDIGTPLFDGVCARRAVIGWLPQFRFPFAEQPGFAFHLDDVLVDGSGVSFVLDQHWTVERDSADPRRLSPRSAKFGGLFNERLRIAIERATGRVVQSRPFDFKLSGWLEFAPLLPLLQVSLAVERDPQADDAAIALTLDQEAATAIDIDLGIGRIRIENLAARGTLDDDALRAGGSARFTATLPGWNSGAIEVGVALEVGTSTASLDVTIPNLALGPLGRVSSATLRIALAQDADGHWQAGEFSLAATLAWRDIAARTGMANAPPQVPRPPDDAQVIAAIQWAQGGGLALRFEAQAGDPSSLFAFLPPAFRPEVRDLGFGFEAQYVDAASFFAAASGAALAGRLFAGFRFRPLLTGPFDDVIALRAGDADGFVGARMSARIDAAGVTTLTLEALSPLQLDIAVPGITHGPLLSVALAGAEVSFSGSGRVDATTRVRLQLTGQFAVQLSELAPPALLAAPLTRVLRPLMLEDLTGEVTATLELRDERASLDLACTLARADVEIDLLAILGELANGRSSSRDERAARADLDIDLGLAFALRGFLFRAGSLDGDDDDFAVEVRFSSALAGARIEGYTRFSREAFELGIDSARLPLQMPAFPLAPADLAALAGPGGAWTRQTLDAALADWQRQLASLSGRHARSARGVLQSRLGVLRFIDTVWSQIGSDAARRQYQDLVTALVDFVAGVQSVTHSDSRPHLDIASAQLRVPFDDPRGTGVEGSAVIQGFDNGDPLAGLNGTELTLGLSSDQVYFALKGTGDPLPLPTVAGYSGGEIALSQLSFGYGFTRNSFALAFAGALKLPDGLARDADTSSRLGAGIRLPQHTRLSFRLDMIPVPGPIPVVPVFEFSLDLRSPGTPALAGTRVCAPAWDGLQLNIPGFIRTDLKAVAVSPVFGILPAANLRFDGDLDLGNANFGLTLVIDELLVINGLGTPPNTLPIPMLMDPMAPFFDHLCVNARFAGFGINFDLQRPFPLPNPMLAFEVLGLIADPMKPVDPAGPLARSIRIALNDAHVSIPTWARPLIPGGTDLLRHEINVEINVATLISAVQWIVRVGGQTFEAARNAVQAGQARLQQLVARPPALEFDDFFAVLPPQLREFACELSFAGFDASAHLVLTDVVVPSGAASPPGSLTPFKSLRDLDIDDLRALPPAPAQAASVLVSARVRVLDTLTCRFFGRLSNDGSFALVTRLGSVPLSLDIAGIAIRLPLEFDARLALSGRVSAKERRADILATGRGRWDVVPGVLRVTAGQIKPVALRLDSRGRFTLRGEGSVELLGPIPARIDGTLDASEAHLCVTGAFRFALGPRPRPLIEITAQVACRVGPGPGFALAGRGELRLFDLRFADIAVAVSEHAIAVRGSLARQRWRVGPLQFDTHVSGSFAGEVATDAAGAPELALAGRGRLEALGATIEGALEIQGNLQRTRVAASGAFSWLGRRWLDAGIVIDTRTGIAFNGRTSVVLDLTPANLPANIQIAHLFLRADIGGLFSFGPLGELASHDFTVDWMLGVGLPGGAPGQTFVLAMQKLRVAGNGAPNVELVKASGFTFVPVENLMIPVPTITWNTETMYQARINIAVLDQVPVLLTTSLIDRLETDFGANILKNKKSLFTVPKDLRLGVDNVSLGEMAAAMDFRVQLTWQQGELQFAVRRGRDPARFYKLSDLL